MIFGTRPVRKSEMALEWNWNSYSGNVEEVKDIATRLPYSGTAILVLAFI